MNSSDPVLELQDVSKHFQQSSNIIDELKSRILGEKTRPIRAVDDVSLTLRENEVQGVIGESGCGKSTLLLTLAGQHNITSGEVLYKGTPRSKFTKDDWKQYRQNVQVIFQDPFNVMDPKFTVRETLLEPLKIHGHEEQVERCHEMLEQVHLTPTEEYIDRREPQLSGGEKQRVAIARGLILEPEVILADEPVSMLDVSTQAAVLQLLNELTDDFGVSMLYISHDLSTIPHICDKANVMYLGRIVESTNTEELLENPKHPYTQELRRAIPIPDPHHDRERTVLQGTPSDPVNLPSGCRFRDRCPEAMNICKKTPLFIETGDDKQHKVACHLHYDHEEITEQGVRPAETATEDD